MRCGRRNVPAVKTPASSTRCWRPTRPVAPRSPPPTTCAPSRRPPARRSARRRRRSGLRCWRSAKELAEKVKAAEAEQADGEQAFTAAQMAISNVIIDGVPSGGEDDFVVLDTVGEPPAIERPERPCGARRVARADRHRARREGVRRAVLLPHRLRRATAARPDAARGAAGDGERLHSRHPAGAGAPGDHGRHRFPRRAQRRGVPRRRRRPVSRRHVGGPARRLPLRRDPRPVRGPAALCGLVVMLPPRGGQPRQGHPRHHPRAPVRQGRGVRLLQAGGGRGRARPAAGLGAGDAGARSRCPTA